MFSRKPANADVSLGLNDYMASLQHTPIFVQYKALVGGPIAQAHAAVIFDCCARSKDKEGYWAYNAAFATNSGPVQPNTPIKFQSTAGKDTFLDVVVSETFKLDYKKIVSRQPYMVKLRNDALRGFLKTQLDGQTQPERTYYRPIVTGGSSAYASLDPRVLDLGAKLARIAGPGGRERAQENLTKAKAWVRSEMKDSPTEQIAQSQRLIDTYASDAGTWPLSFKTIADIFDAQVKGAPPYRKVSSEGETYPSNFGGTYLLMDAMSRMAETRLPKRGDPGWTNWALYAYAAIMAAQAFTDGNKRVARVAYATVMVSGGIDFRAPTPKLGGSLANMRSA
jgi:hypothetical protein